MLDGKVSDKSITYDIGASHENNGKEGSKVIQCAGEMPGGIIPLDAEREAVHDNQGAGDKLDVTEPLAGRGDEGNAHCAVSKVGVRTEGDIAAAEASEAAGNAVVQETEQAGEKASETAGDGQAAEGVNGQQAESQTEGGADNPCSRRPAEGEGSCEESGYQPQELLQVGEAGSGGDDRRPSGPKFRSTRFGGRRGEGGSEEEVA